MTTKLSFKLTDKQKEAQRLVGSDATDSMLFGGSRSGKTFILVRIVVLRALAAAFSRHAILRFRFNHIKASIVLDTFPKVMRLCFPDVKYRVDKSDWYVELPNGSQIWFGGLDDKERTEKILGQEYVTLYLNECSQIPYGSVLLAQTRLAQVVTYEDNDQEVQMRPKMLHDCNPPSKAHWTYKVFVEKRDPESNKKLENTDNYVSLKINPKDNKDNLSQSYLNRLKGMPVRMRKRFWDGDFAEIVEGAYWTEDIIEKWREEDVPDMQRLIVSVDPSGAGDSNNADNDAIGIIVGGLGVDGNAYVLEDLTIKAGPKKWGEVVSNAFTRHSADLVVGESNFGGEMVKFVVKTANPDISYKSVHASRGKVVRAEPISSLTEQGKVRFVGEFPELESELCAFTSSGYEGDSSPNRADAFIWMVTELFPKIVKKERQKRDRVPVAKSYSGPGAWMG